MPPSAGAASAGGDGDGYGDAASRAGRKAHVDRTLVRIGRALGVTDHPQTRLEMLNRFQALDADGSGIISSVELIEGRRRERARSRGSHRGVRGVKRGIRGGRGGEVG